MRNSVKQSLFPYLNPAPARRSGVNCGSILIVSIWVLAFFSILSAGLCRIVSSQIRLVKSLEDRITCLYLAKAAYIYANLERKEDQTTYDTLYELRHQRERQLGRGKFIYTFIDEESKLNINTASKEIIARLPGLTLELAQNLIKSKLRPFHLKEEILLVEGINEEVYNASKDFITVYTDGKVNINTAHLEVLRALGLDDDLILTINDFRLGKDDKEFTEDDGVFQNSAEVINKLRSFRGLYESGEVILLQLISQGLISVGSNNFTLEIETMVLNRPAMKYDIVIDKEKLKSWREY